MLKSIFTNFSILLNSNIDKFAGGLTRGEVTIIGGRPGHGKTTLVKKEKPDNTK